MGKSSRSGCGPESSARELYNVDSDFSQANDLAAADPEKRRALQDLWLSQAAKHRLRVPPLDWLGAGIRFSTGRMECRSLIPEKMTVELKAK